MALLIKGQRIGRWTVLEDQRHTFIRKVNCKCDCGTKTKVDVFNLHTSRSNSCGCINKEILAKTGRSRLRHPVLNGEVYGRLTVVDGSDRNKVQCLCECGNTCITRASSLYQGNTRSCGCLKREIAVALGKKSASLGGLSKHTLHGSWERICRGTVPMHEPWRTNLALFIEDVEKEIGSRPKGMILGYDTPAGYVPGNLKWVPRNAHLNQRVILSEEQRAEVVKLIDSGVLQHQVAEQFKVSASLVSSIYTKHRQSGQ